MKETNRDFPSEKLDSAFSSKLVLKLPHSRAYLNNVNVAQKIFKIVRPQTITREDLNDDDILKKLHAKISHMNMNEDRKIPFIQLQNHIQKFEEFPQIIDKKIERIANTTFSCTKRFQEFKDNNVFIKKINESKKMPSKIEFENS